MRKVGRQLSPALRKIWKPTSRGGAPDFPRRNLRIGRRLRDPRTETRRLGVGVAVDIALMTLMMVTKVARWQNLILPFLGLRQGGGREAQS